MFLFARYTSTAYIDVVSITNDNLSTDDSGAMRLKYRRGKNGKLCRVKLLYNTIDESRPIFPLPNRNMIWYCIHEIGIMAGVKENLSYHDNRHTFGTLMLSAGIPIESISKMMGHTNIRTTQIYARVTDDKISEDMDRLIEKRKIEN